MNLPKNELELLLPKIVLFPVSDIRLNPNNPRRITERQFKSLVKSVEEFWKMLFLRPLIIDEENIILGGNMRSLAAKKLGWKHVPVIQAAHLTTRERAEFIVKDNLPFGDWDFEALANNWDEHDLAEWGLPIPRMEPLAPLDYRSGGSGDGLEDQTANASKPKTTTSGKQTFDILLRPHTELARQELLTLLTGAGYLEDEHFILL